MGCIYEVTNDINGKRYIGKTNLTMDKRKRSHLREVQQGGRLAIRRVVLGWILSLLQIGEP